MQAIRLPTSNLLTHSSHCVDTALINAGKVKEVKISTDILTIVMNDLKTVASKDQVLNSILKTVRR